MFTSRLQRAAGGLLAGLAGAILLLASGADAQEQKKDKLELDKIPKAVMDALKARFPKADIQKWTKAKEGDDVVYDIEFLLEKGRKGEADIKENGTYINYELEIPANSLPKVVREAIDKKYPKSTLTIVMEEKEVMGKTEKLSAYEVTIQTSEKKEVELRLAPDGKILEDTGAK